MANRHGYTMVFCPVAKKMVIKGDEQQIDQTTGAPAVIPPLKPFISPITGEEITCREQLRRHNRDNGVTDFRDYSPEYRAEKQKERHNQMIGNTPEAKAERIAAIQKAMHRR